MNRRAVLGCSRVTNRRRELLSAFASFLCSDLGGAWEESELQILTDPTVAQITDAVRAAEGADYFLGYFIAHGALRRGARPWRQLFADFGGEELSEAQLNPGNPWCTLILDSSSGGTAEPPQIVRTRTNATSRATFDEALGHAERGLIKAWAPPTGGVDDFTFELLQHLATWAKSESDTLSCQEVFDAIAGTVYECGRRIRHFPIAVLR
jgi:hypothetical protein